jgi:hypothetical protein
VEAFCFLLFVFNIKQQQTMPVTLEACEFATHSAQRQRYTVEIPGIKSHFEICISLFTVHISYFYFCEVIMFGSLPPLLKLEIAAANVALHTTQSYAHQDSAMLQLFHAGDI